MAILEIQSISMQVCFVVEKASGALVWFCKGQSWWSTPVAEKHVLKSNTTPIQ